jgi:Flp pilus assembly protein TadG
MKPNRSNSKALSPAALLRRAFWRGFARDQRGTTIVEFALLALPFFAIVGAILETAFFFLSSQLLDSAVDISTRLIRTGQAQTQGYTAEAFRNSICDNLLNLFDCSPDKFRVNVETTSTFSSASFAYPLELDEDTDEYEWTDTQVYSPGEGDEIVTVRVYYKWPTMLDLMGFNLANVGEGHRLMASVRVFKNEPF